MATNPPITIGELANVPAPGSGVKSAWAQDVTNRIVQHFASIADRDARWPAAVAGRGAMCVTLDADVVWKVGAALTWVPVAGPVPWTQLLSPGLLVGGWVPTAAGYMLPAFRMIGDTVQIRGMVKSGAVGPVFTLPAGYAPIGTIHFPQYHAGAFSFTTVIGGTGEVRAGATSTNLSLTCEYSVLGP